MENNKSTLLIDIKEAAELLNVSAQQTRNLCNQDRFECFKVGSSWVIDKLSLEAYINNTHNGKVLDQHNDNKRQSFDALNFDRPKVLSFFSGAMGMDLGLEKAGFEVVLACEVDNACRKTIKNNRKGIALIGDIRDYSTKDIRQHAKLSTHEDIDLMVGGPPCQAFSTAGKRKAFEDERGNVFLTFIDRIVELRPKYFVIENVRGLLSAPLKHRPHEQRGKDYPSLTDEELPGGAFRYIMKRLNKSGYGISFNLYNTANFGTPQIRERVVIIGSRSGEILPFLSPTHSQNGDFGLPPWRTFEDAVSKLKGLKHRYIEFPEKRKRFYKLIPPGGNWKKLSTDLQKEALGNAYYSGGGKTGFLRRLAWDKPAPTLVTHPAMPATDLAHPEELRPLSIQEYKAIQEFEQEWDLAGTLIEQYKQIGNAVPLSLGKAIGRLVINHMKGEKIVNPEGFNYSRYSSTDHLSYSL